MRFKSALKEVKSKALTQAELGHLKKSESPPLRHLIEFRISNPEEYELGGSINVDLFSPGELVDVVGKTSVVVSLVIRNGTTLSEAI